MTYHLFRDQFFAIELRTQILFTANEDARHLGTVLFQLVDPLALHIGQALGLVNGEANENDVAVRIAEGPQPIIVFLAYNSELGGGMCTITFVPAVSQRESSTILFSTGTLAVEVSKTVGT